MPRVKANSHLKPTKRDYELLRGLFHCRLLTIEIAGNLHFRGSAEAARKRLTKLCNAGYIKKRRGKLNEQNIYVFTKAGFELLKDKEQLGRYADMNWTEEITKRATLKRQGLEHELMVMKVKAALEPAINAQEHFEVIEFGTWPRLYQFKVWRPVIDAQGYKTAKEEMLRPDGFLRIYRYDNTDNRDVYDLFLEVDMGTASHTRLADKGVGYEQYYESGRFAARYGSSGAPKEKYPFRVLFVVASAERSNNICEHILQSDEINWTRIWLTSFKKLLTDPLGSIWMRPRDYLDATAGTPYDPDKRRNINAYVRDPERERFVAQRVHTWSLFESPRLG